jgi:hypothetical protein
MKSQEKYQYQALPASDSILIKLQPSADLNAQIQCELIPTSLTECEKDITNPYTAISYVWGDPKYTRTILVDGKPLDSRPLWIQLFAMYDPRTALQGYG